MAQRDRQSSRYAARCTSSFQRRALTCKYWWGYRYPGAGDKGAVEVYPVSGKKLTAAAQAAGLSPSSIPVLFVEGDNRTGLGYAITRAIGDVPINLGFAMAQVVGRRYSAIFGFQDDADASKAATLIKKATSAKRNIR